MLKFHAVTGCNRAVCGLIVLLIVSLSACVDTRSTSSSTALTPVWLLESNSADDLLMVSGRVLSAEFSSDSSDDALIQIGIDDVTELLGLRPATVSQDIPDNGIRLADGDVMSVLHDTRRSLLYRRAAPFTYRASITLNQSDTTLSLRLDYSAARFAPTVVETRPIVVENLTLAERAISVPLTGTINLSWLSSGLEARDGYSLLQGVVIEQTGCTGGLTEQSSHASTVSLQIPVDAQSFSIVASQLPDAPAAGESCDYSLHVVALQMPASLLGTTQNSNIPPTLDNSIVAWIGRSASVQISVQNSLDVMQ